MDAVAPDDGPSSEQDREKDHEFDPPVEMMVNDFDDERTLDEEEAMEQPVDTQNEVSELQRESEMPIEELLKKYGYTDDGAPLLPDDDEEEEEDDDEEEEEEEEDEAALKQLYHEIPAETEAKDSGREPEPDKSGTTARLLRFSRPAEKEGADHDYQPEEEDWKKTIMVGSDYQAGIPEGLCRYDDALPYENEDKVLWDPSALSEEAVINFLRKVPGIGAANGSPRDDEQALHLLLQCGYNVDEALRRQQMNVVPPTDTMSLWSEEECLNFENGLRTYGKDFHLIQQNKVRTRSVGELVQFYYLWKKTERHDVFANEARADKKKHTGIPLALWSVLEMEL